MEEKAPAPKLDEEKGKYQDPVEKMPDAQRYLNLPKAPDPNPFGGTSKG